MERLVAVKKLRKLLGKNFGYEIHKNAPTPEARSDANAQLKEASSKREQISKRMEARRNAILAADTEYQTLLTEYGAARKRVDQLMSTAHHYKITVGTANKLFFHVRAEGDTWEEIFNKLKQKS